ncbi:hypothetical protein D3C78_946550 [compost metagenome]
MFNRFIEAIALLEIELLVILIRQLVLISPPDRNHAVNGLLVRIFLKLVLFSAFLRPLALHIHLDRISNEIGVFLDDGP